MNTIAENVGVYRSVLQNWIKQYQFNGEKAFEKRYTSYTTQYKLDVLNYMNENGTSIRETAAIFNIPGTSTIAQWKRNLETQGIDGLQPRKRGVLPRKKNQINHQSQHVLKDQLKRSKHALNS